jgi:GntR family transcriptional regulator
MLEQMIAKNKNLKYSEGTPPVPVYFQIKNVIKKRISEGIYPLGTKIPSEHELSGEFGVNRQTVRHALTLLVQEGYLNRFRKRGTFISAHVKEFDGLELSGLFDDLLTHVARFKAKKIRTYNQMPPVTVADLFQLNPKIDKVRVIKRVRFLGESPAAYTINYLPLEIGNRISKEDLYQMPLLQIFKEKLKIPLGEAFQTIEASIADSEVSDSLGITRGTQVLLMQRTFFTRAGKPFDFVQTFYRGDKFRYFVRFRYDDGGNHVLLTRE